jgi:hypothetical protein
MITLRRRLRSIRRTPRRSPRADRQTGKPLEVLDGYVREVVDARTIDLNLTKPTPELLERYHACELIRLVGLSVEALPADEVIRDLRQRLHRRQVRCFIHGRDAEGRLLAVAVPVAAAG